MTNRHAPDASPEPQQKLTRRQTQILREERALNLRVAGFSLQQIVDQIPHFSYPSDAHRAIRNAYARSAPAHVVEAAREVELTRLDQMTRAIWPAVLRGDLLAMDRALKIMNHRMRLLGLNKEPSLDLERFRDELRRAAEAEGLDPDEVVAEAEGYLARHR